jgi:hypothetical protein
VPALRQEYQAKFGKKPFNGWDAATLREKIAEGRPMADAAELIQSLTVLSLQPGDIVVLKRTSFCARRHGAAPRMPGRRWVTTRS